VRVGSLFSGDYTGFFKVTGYNILLLFIINVLSIGIFILIFQKVDSMIIDHTPLLGFVYALSSYLLVLFLYFLLWSGPYFILESHSGFFQSVSRSIRLSFRNPGSIIVGLLMHIFILVGILALVFGLFWVVGEIGKYFGNDYLIFFAFLTLPIAFISAWIINRFFMALLYMELTASDSEKHSLTQ